MRENIDAPSRCDFTAHDEKIKLAERSWRANVPTAGGLILILPDQRVRAFDDALDEGFAEPVGDFRHSRRDVLICFICRQPGMITHIGRAKRGVSAGTRMRRVNLDRIVPLREPIAAQNLLDHMRPRFVHRLESLLAHGGYLRPATFSAMVEAVTAINGEAADLLRRYDGRIDAAVAALPNAARLSLALQKDAVSTAVRLSGIDNKELEWLPDTTKPLSSFLDGLPEVRLREDQMLARDLTYVPGYDLIRTMPHGAAYFESQTTRLTVVLANRLDLEHQLGVDLIYCNETYGAFTMVQYKAMDLDANGPCFRLPNEQLALELERMDATMERLQTDTVDGTIDDFRLRSDPFFLKLCPRVVMKPDNVGLIDGMYFPLSLWRLLEQDPAILGPRGGRIVTRNNSRRYLTNSMFISLVGEAWVGTVRAQTNILENLIRSLLESGHAIVVAVSSQEPAAAVPLRVGE